MEKSCKTTSKCKYFHNLRISSRQILHRQTSNEKPPELKTLEWNILNPDRLIKLEINIKRMTSII